MTVPAEHAPAPRLVVENLCVRLAGSPVDVVDEVTFSVNGGEVLGLVGESGSGKTTVGLALLGHARRGLRIHAGTVRLDGTEILACAPEELRALRGAGVAYVPQDPSAALDPAMRIGALLREGLRNHGLREGEDDRIREVLREVSLTDVDDVLRRYPHQLSGGQQQRVALAMAFSCRPGLIVLDEPTTGLDVTTQAHVLKTVRRLCGEYQVAAVYVSHDLAVVRQLAHRVVVMYAGRIVENGPWSQVFSAPAHPYTARLLQAIPSPEHAGMLVGIPGHPPRPNARPRGCTFAPRCPIAVDRCLEAPPPLVAVGGTGGDHVARCIRLNEMSRAERPESDFEVARPAGDCVLAAAGLIARYGDRQVLHDMSFTLLRESCLAIVGESGSGKTTLARCVVGMHSRWSGQLEFSGRPLAPRVADRPRDVLRAIQYVGQNPYGSLNPRKTVGQLVAQPLEHFARPPAATVRERVASALEEVSLPRQLATAYPDELSGGERQRVAIARALIVDPEVLVCDEVTSALDVSVQAIIVELLRSLQRERSLAMVFITHDLALVRSIAQQVVVVRDGHVQESGAVDQVLDRPTDAYTVRLLENVPRLEGQTQDEWRDRSHA